MVDVASVSEERESMRVECLWSFRTLRLVAKSCLMDLKDDHWRVDVLYFGFSYHVISR